MPIGWGLAAVAGGGVLSGIIGGGAAEKAASEEASAINAATQAEVNMYNQTVAREQPWVTAGTNALSTVQNALGLGSGGTGSINPATFTGSPGYQFQLQQGLGAVQNQATTSGGPLSGNALKALQTYGTGLANQDWYNYLSQVTGLSNTGAQAAANLGATGTSVANSIAGNTIAGGQAQAAGTVGAANAVTSGLQGVSQSALLYALLQGGGLGGSGLGASALTGGIASGTPFSLGGFNYSADPAAATASF
jgi:hypothetical protein